MWRREHRLFHVVDPLLAEFAFLLAPSPAFERG
jgi:hypothetical protein